MSAVPLPEPTLARIRSHAEDEAPREACGLVCGEAVHPARNLHPTPLTHFDLDPAALLRNPEPTAIYHSHVEAPATLSAADRAAAALWPAVDHLVVEVRRGRATEVRCYASDGTHRWTR